MSQLFDPLTLRGATMRNRIGVPPMCQYSAQDGFANDYHLVHYGARAVGGAGLIIIEATAVERRGQISPNDLGIWSDEHTEPLARIADFMRGYGAMTAVQIAHAGRKAGTASPWLGGLPLSDAEGGWQPVGPSPLPFNDAHRTPSQLTVDELAEIKQKFVDGAIRADAAGLDMVELHAAHGYLLHSFHSPLSNQREDSYGGSLENRIRFTLEVVKAVREEWPEDKPLAVRLSCTDWVDGGWTLEESIELSRKLKALGVDLIDCSSGGGSPKAVIAASPGFQVPFAAAIRTQVQIPTAAVGFITQPMQAAQIIGNGEADIVLLGREALRNPYWPLQAAKTLNVALDALAPNQYKRSL